jgi:hypothetical protein
MSHYRLALEQASLQPRHHFHDTPTSTFPVFVHSFLPKILFRNSSVSSKDSRTPSIMPADPTVFLLKSYLYLPAQSADSLLGRIVENYHSPNDNFAPQDPLQYNMYDIIPMEYQRFSLGASQKNKAWASILAEHIGHTRWVGEGDSRISLEGKRIWSKRLQQHDEFFDAVKEDPKVIARVPSWVSRLNSHVCMIVGVFLCEDVAVSEGNHQTSTISGEAQIPIGTAASTSVGTPAPLTVGNVKISAGREVEEHKNFQASGNGQFLFGLELKLVKKKSWINSKELKLTNKAPNVIPGRKLGPEEGDTELWEEVDAEEGDIDAKLVGMDDELAQELYDASLQDIE